MKPFKVQIYKPTLADLKARAKKHGLIVRKFDDDSYILAWRDTNSAPADVPTPLTLEQVASWLDDLDDSDDEPF